jgi:hypothetical protein
MIEGMEGWMVGRLEDWMVGRLEGWSMGTREAVSAAANCVSSQYLGVRAGLAPAQAGNRKGLPLLFEKISNC